LYINRTTEWIVALRQVLVFFNFSDAEGKGESFCGDGVPTMMLEQVQQAKEQTR
jgi:hypothetical protein